MRRGFILGLVYMLLMGLAIFHSLPNEREEERAMDYRMEEMSVMINDQRIVGYLYTPVNHEAPMPAVIFSHGFGGDHSVGDPYARFLASRGYVVYCFDFRGGGPQSLSDGSTLEMSIFTEQADLEAVIDAISQLNLVDKSRLYLMGTSQGGVVSSLAAAANPERIAGLILFYPAYVLVDEANRLFPDPASIPNTYHFMWMDVGRAYFEPLFDYDVYAAIAAYPKKVLIVHGDADRIVPLSYSQKATEVYADSRLVVIEGGGHGFSGNKQEQAMNEIWNYLEEQNA